MARSLSDIKGRITLDNSDFLKKMKQVERIGDSVSKVGRSLSTNLTLPIVALGAVAGSAYKQYDSMVKALETIEGSSEKVGKRLEILREIAKQPGLSFQEAVQGDVRLRAVGLRAEQAAKVLREFGNAIAQTGGGGEELKTVTTQLGQLVAKGKVYAQDLKPIIEAAPAVGKALKSLFGTVDSESIQKALEAAGKNSEQFLDILLNKLAEAPRVTGGFKNSLENLKDSVFVFGATVGKSADEAFDLTGKIGAMADKVNNLTKRIEELDPVQKRVLFGTVGGAAAAGPILSLLGGAIKLLPSFTAGLKGLGDGFSLLVKNGGKVALVTTAILLLADNIKPLLSLVNTMVDRFKSLYESSILFQKTVDVIVGTVKGVVFVLTSAFNLVSAALSAIFGTIESLVVRASSFIEGILTLDSNKINEGANKAGQILSNAWGGAFKKFYDSQDESFKSLFGNGDIKKDVVVNIASRGNPYLKRDLPTVTTFDGLGVGKREENPVSKIFTDLNKEIKAVNTLVESGFIPNTDRIEKQLNAVEDAAKKLAELGLGAASREFKKLEDVIKGFDKREKIDILPSIPQIPNLLPNSLQQATIESGKGLVKGLNESMADTLKTGLEDAVGYLGRGLDRLTERANRAAVEIGQAISKSLTYIEPAINGIGNIIGQYFSNKEAGIDNIYAKEKTAIENSRLTEEQKASAIRKLDEETDKRRRSILRKQAIASKALAIFESLINTARGVASALATGNIPLAAIIGGLGAAQTALIAGTPIPALAKGGLAYGPTFALIGEYGGARSNPEVVAPLDKLKDMIGSGSQQVFGMIAGTDIYLSNQRSGVVYSRYV